MSGHSPDDIGKVDPLAQLTMDELAEEFRVLELCAAVQREIRRARGLFPDPNLLTLAHAEEAGELTKAVLEEPLENVRKEAIQAAAMALRLVLDGDPSTDAHREKQGLQRLGNTHD